MLQQIREQARGVFGWIILGAIVVVLTLFGFGAFTAFVSGEPTVAEVGDAEITRAELEQGIDRQRRQIMSSMGPDADPSAIDDALLSDRVLASLVERRLLLEGARSAGMVVSEEEIDRVIVGMEPFRSEGRFDPDRFQFVLGTAGMTPSGFRSGLREDLLIQQLAQGLGESSFTTQREFADMAALLLQERDTAWLRFDPQRFREQVAVEESLLRDFYQRHLDDYFAEAQVQLRYVMLERDAIVDDVEVDEAAIRGAYEREMEAFEAQERRRASHILINTGEARSEAEALSKAEELRSRIMAGEDFAELAQEFSDDPASAQDGGDLGMTGRDTFVPPFEQALFELETVGEVSEPVVTQFGVHLIRLEEIASSEPQTYEEMRPALLARLEEEAARARFTELRQELDTLAFETPDLEEPAAALGLEILEAGPFTRRGGEGLFGNEELIRAAFSREVLEEGYNSSALEVGDGRVVVLRVAEHEPARQRDYEEVAEDVRADYLAVESQRLATEAAEAALIRLQDGAGTGSVADLHGLSWQRQDGLTRNDAGVPGRVREEAFALPHPDDGDRSVGSVELADGSQVLVVVTNVRPGDPALLSSDEREQLDNLLRNSLREQEFESYQQALRRDLGVTIIRGDS